VPSHNRAYHMIATSCSAARKIDEARALATRGKGFLSCRCTPTQHKIPVIYHLSNSRLRPHLCTGDAQNTPSGTLGKSFDFELRVRIKLYKQSPSNLNTQPSATGLALTMRNADPHRQAGSRNSRPTDEAILTNAIPDAPSATPSLENGIKAQRPRPAPAASPSSSGVDMMASGQCRVAAHRSIGMSVKRIG
jgi:hypothetical protein